VSNEIPSNAEWNGPPPEKIPPAICDEPGCGQPLHGLGKCHKHHVILVRATYLERKRKEAQDNNDPALVMPAHWANLPESTDPRPDVLWAYNNYMHVEERPGANSRIYWGRMTDPPTRAAPLQIRILVSNPMKVQDLMHKAASKEETTDPEQEREERRSVQEVRKILATFKKDKKDEPREFSGLEGLRIPRGFRLIVDDALPPDTIVAFRNDGKMVTLHFGS
jgi:hypothetical protein